MKKSEKILASGFIALLLCPLLLLIPIEEGSFFEFPVKLFGYVGACAWVFMLLIASVVASPPK